MRAEARSSVEENLGSCCLHSGLDRGAGDPGTLGSPEVHRAEGDRGASGDSTHNGLTNSDAGNLAAVFEHEISRNTIINYRAQWSRFTAWAFGKGVSPLPADPALVAAYLAERMENHGHRPATLRTAASAIGFMHRASGLEDPRASQEVRGRSDVRRERRACARSKRRRSRPRPCWP